MIPLLLWTMVQFQEDALFVSPTPAAFDFTALPVAGATDVPPNAQLLIPVPLDTFGAELTSQDQYTFALLLDDDVEVGNTQEVQLVTHACFDMEVVRLLPTLPLLPQTRYRVVITPDDPNTPAFEATSFVTGDSADNDPPPSPIRAAGAYTNAFCGVTFPISHAPQTVVTSLLAGGQWSGLSSASLLQLDGSGSSSFTLVAIDVAGNVSPPTVVNIDFPDRSYGRNDCGCHQRGGAAPSWLLVMALWLLVKRQQP